MIKNPRAPLPPLGSQLNPLINIGSTQSQRRTFYISPIQLGCSIRNVQLHIGNVMPYKWRVCDVLGWHPETREGATLTRIRVQYSPSNPTEERAYLFGGLSRDLHSSIVYLSQDSTRSNDSLS